MTNYFRAKHFGSKYFAQSFASGIIDMVASWFIIKQRRTR